MAPELDIVIPVYNEGRNIVATLATLAEHLKTPASFASEAYTLREHIGLVRRTVLAKAGAATRPA